MCCKALQVLPSVALLRATAGNDSTCKRYTHDTLVNNGVFHIKKNAYKNDQGSYDEIFFDSDTSLKSLIILNYDMLTIRPLIPDLGTTDYQKIGD